MPFSSDFLANTLPAAQAYMTPQASFETAAPLASTSFPLPGPVPPPAPPGPPADAGASPAFAAPPPPPPGPPPMNIAGSAVGAPPPPLAQIPEPPPQQPQNMLVRGTATPAHEVMTKGEAGIHYMNKQEQDKLEGLQGATQLRNEGLLARGEAADEAERKYAEEAKGYQGAMAANQRSLTEANQFVQDATKEGQNIAPITGYWQDRGVGAQIGNYLAMAVAGMGQAISGDKGPNPVMALLQSNMDHDLKVKQLNFQRQTGEAAAKTNAAQQYYDNLARQVGIEGADKLYSAAQKEAAAAHAEKLASASGINDNLARASELAGNYRAQADKDREDAVKLVQASKGADTIIVPELGGARLTQKEFNDYQVKKALQGNELNSRAEVAAAKAEAGAAKADKTAEGTRFIAKELESSKVIAGKAAADQALQHLLPQVDPRTGKATPAEEGYINPASAAGFQAGAPGRFAFKTIHGEQAAQAEQDWIGFKAGVMNALSGGTVSDQEERKRLTPMLDGANTADARRHAIAAAKEALDRKERSIKAGAGPEAAAAYEANLAGQQPPPIKTYAPVK